MRYIVYDRKGNFAQSYNFEIGEENALRYADYTCKIVKGILIHQHKDGREIEIRNYKES